MEVNSGNLQVAIDWFTEMVDAEPECALAYMGRGSALSLMQMYERGIRDFTRAIDLDSTLAEAFKRRGQAKAARGLLKDAVKDLTKAAELGTIFKRDYDTFHQRGLILFRLKEFERAFADFKHAVNLEPRHTDGWLLMGQCLHALGQHLEVREHCDIGS